MKLRMKYVANHIWISMKAGPLLLGHGRPTRIVAITGYFRERILWFVFNSSANGCRTNTARTQMSTVVNAHQTLRDSHWVVCRQWKKKKVDAPLFSWYPAAGKTKSPPSSLFMCSRAAQNLPSQTTKLPRRHVCWWEDSPSASSTYRELLVREVQSADTGKWGIYHCVAGERREYGVSRNRQRVSAT